jgi:hypothetical protein
MVTPKGRGSLSNSLLLLALIAAASVGGASAFYGCQVDVAQ